MFTTLIIIMGCFAVLVAGVIAYSNIADKVEKAKHAASKPVTPPKKNFIQTVSEVPWKAFETAVKSYVKEHPKTPAYRGVTGVWGTKGIVGSTGIVGQRGCTGTETGMVGCTGSYDDPRGYTGSDQGCTGSEQDIKNHCRTTCEPLVNNDEDDDELTDNIISFFSDD